MSNTITAYFKGRKGVAESLYQNDYGMVMVFDGIELPAHFDCYFSIQNQEEAVPGVGVDNRVAIPNSVLANSGNVTIHIPLHTGENDSEVEYVVYFKVIGRARPIDDGTPVQMTAIEQALALLQNPIGNIEQIVNEALAFTGDTFAEMQAQLDADQAAFKAEVENDIADDIADVEADFSNLNAQFQAAVSALTVDDELINVRVGDDNVTYATAGEATREQFSNLKEALISTNITTLGNEVKKNIAITRGGWHKAIEFAVVKGRTYTIAVVFSNQLAASFYTSVENKATAVTSKTFGVQTYGGTISFTAGSDAILNLKYLTNDSANTSCSVAISSPDSLMSELKTTNESLALSKINTLGGSDSVTVNKIQLSLNTKILDVSLEKGMVYGFKVSYSAAPSSNVIIRGINSDNVELFTKTCPSGWQEVSFEYVCEQTEELGIWYLTTASNISDLTLEISAEGMISKDEDATAKDTAFRDDKLKIVDTTLNIAIANQLNDISCNIHRGRTYQCVVTSLAESNRFRYSNDFNSEWVTPMITHKLGDYVFNFVANFDADTFSIYTTTTGTAHITLYEKRDRISPQALRHNDVAVYTGDTKNRDAAYICNAVAMEDGTIIAARGNGTIVKIDLDGTETQIKDFDTEEAHCRCMYFDKVGNLYVSPSYFGANHFVNAGLYRMAKGTYTFDKVLSLYNNSTDTDSTIWTMTEDDAGNLYAGEYSIANANPKIYKSSDGGITWSLVYDFSTMLPDGRHIHWIEYSPWQKALYAIIGEVNTIVKSIDGGETWENLNIELSNGKGCGAITTPNGLIIGSDSDSNLTFHLVENDDKTVRLIDTFWANMCFAIRRNNLNGDLYAFTDIDVSARASTNYPPISVLSLEDPMTGVETWHNELVSQYGSTLGNAYYNKWLRYYNSVADKYPDDAIISHHYGIFISRDGGLSFEVLSRFESMDAGGFNNAGFFFNGECLVGVNGGVDAPVVLSSGKQKYVVGGCDFDGDVFVRTNSSTINNLL